MSVRERDRELYEIGILSVSVRRGAEVLLYTSHVRIYSTITEGAKTVNNGSNIPFYQSASLSAGR